ncbi:MAG TPA: sigma-70 family RNA polymerase sigma factor [Kofleriaceae bacterium]|nr:sigma-70 family RNA polymerase sigma factor [Kofleriaceae bacterium]
MASELAPLASLRDLARALVHGDADADDLLQDTALAAVEHPPPPDRPTGPWLVRVLRNRWRMGWRTDSRRRAREAAVAGEPAVVDAIDAIDRARLLQRVSEALVALAEPFRTTVIRRYLDGASAAQIAREQGVPAGTVRWRLKTGLERLRAALDDAEPARWRRVLVPATALRFAQGGLLVTAKTKIALVLVALVVALLSVWRFAPVARPPDPDTTLQASGSRFPELPPRPEARSVKPEARLPRHSLVEPASAPTLSGRVVNWSTGDGVDGAELTFDGEDGAIALRTDAQGDFELVAPHAGAFTLVTIAATGFLPYAPEYLHSPVRVELAAGRAIRGMQLFLYPALDYHGHVVDVAGAPVEGAHVRLLGTPEQQIYKLATEWASDRAGAFVFHAPDGAVLEATAGARRGWAVLDGKVAIDKQLTIVVGEAAARDQSIGGRVVDDHGQPIADVLVSAEPEDTRGGSTRVGASATTGSDGAFRLDHLDRDSYGLAGEAEGFATAIAHARGGARDVELVLSAGQVIAGAVVTAAGEPVPAFTLLAFRRDGALRIPAATRSIADASGHFELRVLPGKYDLVAAANGWAPSPTTTAEAGATDVKLVVSAGAIVRGSVHSAADGSPVPYARVMREAISGGASAEPANAGTVTRRDGTFELSGVPAGSLSLSIGADGFHERIESGLSARDGGEVGPVDLVLTPLAPGETPNIELVGIGVQLAADHDGLRVDRVIDGSGAQAAGIVVGDHIVQIDGADVTELGMAGSIAKIRGAVGTTVAVTLARTGGNVTLNVERRKLRA